MRLNLQLFKGGVKSGSNAYTVDQGDGSGKNEKGLSEYRGFVQEPILNVGRKSDKALLREMEEKWGEGKTSINPDQRVLKDSADRARAVAANYRAAQVEQGLIPRDARVVVTIEMSADRALATSNLQGVIYRMDVYAKGARKPMLTERLGEKKWCGYTHCRKRQEKCFIHERA